MRLIGHGLDFIFCELYGCFRNGTQQDHYYDI